MSIMRTKKILILLLLLILIDYFSILFLKYHLNNLPLSEFTFTTIGNVVVLSLGIISISSLLILYFKEFNIYSQNITVILVAAFLTLIPIVLIVLINKGFITLKNGYIFTYPIKKATLGILFAGNFSFKLYISLVYILLIRKNGYFSYLKALYYSMFALMLLLVLSFVYSTKYSDRLQTDNLTNEKYDIGVILGAAVWKLDQPSPILKGRILKAYELYNKKIINIIQVTGGKAPGELTEAETAFRYLRKLGVPKRKILIEVKTSTTTEQIKFIKNVLKEKFDFEKIIIISDQFHLKRVLEICKFFNVKAEGISSGSLFNFDKLLYYRVRESVALLLFWLFAI